MPNCKDFLVTWAERKHVGRRARFQQHRGASSHVFFLQGKAPKEILAILTETLGEHAPSYATLKNWLAQFKRDDFSTCDAPRPGRPKTVTTQEIIDQIHELILEDRRISAKSIAEQLGNSRERVGSIIHGLHNLKMCDVLAMTCVKKGTWINPLNTKLTHCGRVTQICVFNTVKLGTSASSP